MPSPPRAGDRVAGHRLEREIGRGATGAVFVARHEATGRLVALKLVSGPLAEDPAFASRFAEQARSTAEVAHPNVVSVLDHGTDRGRPWMAMRLVPGPDLRVLLRRLGRLAPDQALAIAEQVAAGLDAAHARGLVHRDVKPANVLVEHRDGGALHVELVDFGLVAPAGRSVAGGEGTPGYAGPEQLAGGPVSAATDVHALACLLREMLTGDPTAGPERPDDPPATRAVLRVLEAASSVGVGERPASAGALAAAARVALATTRGLRPRAAVDAVVPEAEHREAPDAAEASATEVAGREAPATAEAPTVDAADTDAAETPPLAPASAADDAGREEPVAPSPPGASHGDDLAGDDDGPALAPDAAPARDGAADTDVVAVPVAAGATDVTDGAAADGHPDASDAAGDRDPDPPDAARDAEPDSPDTAGDAEPDPPDAAVDRAPDPSDDDEPDPPDAARDDDAWATDADPPEPADREAVLAAAMVPVTAGEVAAGGGAWTAQGADEDRRAMERPTLVSAGSPPSSRRHRTRALVLVPMLVLAFGGSALALVRFGTDDGGSGTGPVAGGGGGTAGSGAAATTTTTTTSAPRPATRAEGAGAAASGGGRPGRTTGAATTPARPVPRAGAAAPGSPDTTAAGGSTPLLDGGGPGLGPSAVGPRLPGTTRFGGGGWALDLPRSEGWRQTAAQEVEGGRRLTVRLLRSDGARLIAVHLPGQAAAYGPWGGSRFAVRLPRVGTTVGRTFRGGRYAACRRGTCSALVVNGSVGGVLLVAATRGADASRRLVTRSARGLTVD